jgi:DUF4097 and DUF4098 domain-containing protein YvlB
MYKNLTTLVIASVVTLGLSGCSISVGNQNAKSGQNASSTFGNISVNDGERAGKLVVTNGNVGIGANAKVQAIEVVNGNIEIDNFSQAKSLETVNGNIKGGKEVIVTGNVKIMNGKIQFEQGAELGGNVEIFNGDIELARGSTVAGDIIFNKPDGWFFCMSSKTPKLKLGEGVMIGGQIHLYRPVDMTLPDSVSPRQVNRHYDDKE